MIAQFVDLYSNLTQRSLSPYWLTRASFVFENLNLQPDDKLLELGCGSGLWTSFIANHCLHIAAMDTNINVIRRVKNWKTLSNSKSCVLDLVQADGQFAPFASGKFSKVLGVDVIEHIPDDQGAVKEILRVLKPGGRVVLTSLLEDRPHYLHKIEFNDHVREYDLKSFKALFENAGLQISKIDYFYYAPSMLARELGLLSYQIGITRVPGIGFSLGILWRLMCDFERRFPVGKPGGIGISAIKAF